MAPCPGPGPCTTPVLCVADGVVLLDSLLDVDAASVEKPLSWIPANENFTLIIFSIYQNQGIQVNTQNGFI